MPADKNSQIVIRRVKKVSGGGHHGGAWKVAYADFVTAMMAFFLVMWLLGLGTKEQRAAIAEYFKNPTMLKGHSPDAPEGTMGPGGSSTSLIELGGSHDPMEAEQAKSQPPSEKALKLITRELDRKKLLALKQQLEQEIVKSEALAPYRNQLLLQITPDGLSIQIIDEKNRPMFDRGSAALKPYTTEILRVLAGFINTVPNHISISGHTDDAQYAGVQGYSNWELSADRAGAARRALISGGMAPAKIAKVLGLASTLPFNPDDPLDAANRRINILVMTKDAEDRLHETEQPRPPQQADSFGDDDSPQQPEGAPPAESDATDHAAASVEPAADEASAPRSGKPR